MEKETRHEWLNGTATDPHGGPYGMGKDAHVVYPVIDRDDVFVDLLEHPVTTGIVQRMLGPDMMMIDNDFTLLVQRPKGPTPTGTQICALRPA